MSSPADRDDKKVGESPYVENPIFKECPKAWHRFEETGYVVLTTYHGHFLDTLSSWTAQGDEDAIQAGARFAEAMDVATNDPLQVWVIEKVHQFDRLYVGMGTNPRSWMKGAPEKVPMYDDNRLHRDIKPIRATIIWAWHLGRCTGSDAQELPSHLVATSRIFSNY
ncbi:MAG: hypothetical protein V4641_05755 [Pseudomonadota bacterium]